MFCSAILLINIIACIFAACPNGQIQSISDPTICYSFEKTKTNWFAAMQNCKEKEGTLISVHNMFENMFINGEAESVFSESTNSDFWIGGIYNSLSPGKWSWIDNSTFDFTDWDKGQPQNNTDSVCATSKMNGAKWQSADCFIDKPFVCEIKIVSPMTTTTTPKPTVCPDSWTYLNLTNYCYKAFHKSSTWFDAEMTCVDQQAHLASIHSTQENLFITYIAGKDGITACDFYAQAWTGLSRNSGNFQWTDGTPYDYSSWVKYAPIADQDRNCVLVWIGQTCYGDGWDVGATMWENLACSGKALNFVCKKARIS